MFLFFENGKIQALEYLSAYLMEWSLSIDNIFVFILIFTFFKVSESDAGRALLVGILLAYLAAHMTDGEEEDDPASTSPPPRRDR